ncbi:MAG: DNA polymerase V [Pseudomonadales bacterium]|nr:DNA polymerase V [Pseudomonadales bacterium]
MSLHYLTEHETRSLLELPLYLATVQAGFPSPADDYMDKRLDLNEHLIKHDAATFYCRVSGNSMEGAGIHDGDLLIVDRAVEPKNGHIVVATVDGEMACKILDTHNKQLLSANPNYAPIPIGEDSELCVEGVVIHSIRSHVRAG